MPAYLVVRPHALRNVYAKSLATIDRDASW
jgi:hypothetical protein